jgi:glycogen debranching enzyme
MNEASASQFYISARATLDGGRPSRLKHGDSFAVLDSQGDLMAFEGNPDGLYHRDTRHLSHFEIRLNGARPLRLSSNMADDNSALTADLTNPDFFEGNRLALPKDTIHLHRLKFVWDGALYERIAVFNYDEETRRVRISATFDCDFADLFEARGQKRVARGLRRTEVAPDGAVEFDYTGLDGKSRRTRLQFAPPPDRVEPSFAYYDFKMKPQEKRVIFVRIACSPAQDSGWEDRDFFKAFADSQRALRKANERPTQISSSSALVEDVVTRSMADLTMLMTDTEYGPYPYAGIPWFSTPFGRDGIITALMMLWIDPSVARGVLKLLAATQAREINEFRDAEPGKILHEMRFGEMAALCEVPFGLYYGSVDSTPLFVLLAGEYLRRTGDLDTIRALWPNIEAALGWIENHGDIDKDGFVEYRRQRDTGLVNQGWKDSFDSVFHANGDLAEGPIALCEVQAYVYGAWKEAAFMARHLGGKADSEKYSKRAEDIRARFEQEFWCENLGTYALALDGNKKKCAVPTSNPGHALYTGIADAERAQRVAARLLEPDMFSGWGIRTVGQTAARYNPMSYHNGSVWPHDNGLIALGLARYGQKDAVLRVFRGLIEAASHVELKRLPELFCGFGRKRKQGPIGYPVACSPQAWASATPLALLQASLGLTFDHDEREVRFHLPVLPDFIDRLQLRNVQLGASSADLLLTRRGKDAAMTVTHRRGDLRITAVH